MSDDATQKTRKIKNIGFQLSLPPEQAELFVNEAKTTYTTKSQLFLKMLEEYFARKNNEKTIRDDGPKKLFDLDIKKHLS